MRFMKSKCEGRSSNVIIFLSETSAWMVAESNRLKPDLISATKAASLLLLVRPANASNPLRVLFVFFYYTTESAIVDGFLASHVTPFAGMFMEQQISLME
jgi:hypothetical protein